MRFRRILPHSRGYRIGRCARGYALPRRLPLVIRCAKSRTSRADANTGSAPGAGMGTRVSEKATCTLRTPCGIITASVKSNCRKFFPVISGPCRKKVKSGLTCAFSIRGAVRWVILTTAESVRSCEFELPVGRIHEADEGGLDAGPAGRPG